MSEDVSSWYPKMKLDPNQRMYFRIMERRKRCSGCPESMLTFDREGVAHMLPDLDSETCQYCLKEGH